MPTSQEFAEAVLQEYRKLADIEHVEEATGHNDGAKVNEIQQFAGLPSGENWCAATLAVCVKRACDVLGIANWKQFMPDTILGTNVIQDRGRVHAWFRAYKKLGLLGHGIDHAKRGRPFLYVQSTQYQTPGHIGDTAQVFGDDFRTIEGNSRNRVDRRWRHASDHDWFWLKFDEFPIA